MANYSGIKHSTLLLLVAVALPVSSVAQQESNAFRLWHDASGKYEVSALLLSIGPQTVRLRKKEDGTEIDVPIAQLSDEDQAFLSAISDKVKAAETLSRQVEGVKALCTRLETQYGKLDYTSKQGETDAQKEVRIRLAQKNINAILSSTTIHLVVEIANVRKSAPSESGIISFLNPAASDPQYIRRENSRFDVRIVPRDYPILLPTTMTLLLGESASDFSVGDVAVLTVKFGEFNDALGSIKLSWKNGPVSATGKIVRMEKVEKAVGLAQLSQFPIVDDPNAIKRVDTSTITCEEMKEQILTMAGVPFPLAVVKQPEFLAKYGLPNKQASSNNVGMWYYTCSDGVIALETLETTSFAYPGDLFITAINFIRE